MSFTDLFIRRPVVATVINLLILLAGIQAYRTLNVRQYPKSDIAVVEALADLLAKIKLENCRVNEGYLQALGMRAPAVN